LKLVDLLNCIPGLTVVFTPAPSRRAGAAHFLGWFGPAAKAAIPALIEALKSPDESVRGPAAESLGEIHCEPDVIIPLLITYLDDADLNDEAAAALGKFGELAKAAVPKLIPLLKINDKDLQEAVRTALKKIDPEAAAKAGVD
jgi:HEAT repeat protein